MPNVRRCAVIGCHSQSGRNPEISFFRFPPKDNHFYGRWRQACHAHLARILPFKTAYICSKHFHPQLIKNRRLATNAVPSRLLDIPPLYQSGEQTSINFEKDCDRKKNYINAVVYEWLLRANKNPHISGGITHGMIKEKADQAKQLIKCEDFCADNRWLNSFRETYLKDFTKKVLSEELKPFGTSLLIADIVKELGFRYPPVFTDDSMNDSAANESKMFQSDYEENYRDDADDDDSPYVDVSQFSSVDISVPPSPSDELSSDHNIDPSELKTYPQAMEYLKMLEDFAIAQEDFRAINIITLLGEEFRKGGRLI